MDITIENVRFSYCNLIKPKPPYGNPAGTPVYSTVVLIPKTNIAAKEALDAAIAQTAQLGAATKWGGTVPPGLSSPIHDGDGQKPRGGAYGAECRGMWVLNTKTERKPFLRDCDLKPIIDPAEIYSGMWGNVSLHLYPFANTGNNGVTCSLNGIQKTKDDTPLGAAAITAEEAFKPVPRPAPDYSRGI